MKYILLIFLLWSTTGTQAQIYHIDSLPIINGVDKANSVRAKLKKCRTRSCAIQVVSRAYPICRVEEEDPRMFQLVHIQIDRYWKNGSYHVHGGQVPGGIVYLNDCKSKDLSFGWSGHKPKCPQGDWP